tara:strand:- start:30 stop:230 length:201 start_codon:yes stop_codon:yes gene_type:complete
MSELVIHIILVIAGSMIGFMFAALISANKFSAMMRRIHELEHELKKSKQRGRKPQAKKKPIRRRNA